MKKDRLLNPQLIQVIAALGHKDLLVIGDAGLPVPKGVPVIDLSLVHGIPSFIDMLNAVCSELVVEAYTIAEEMETVSPALYRDTRDILRGLPFDTVPHDTFKQITRDAKAIVRTGETTSFANVILRCGVNF